LTCDPDRVTAYVDDALAELSGDAAAVRAEIEAHLAACPDCAEQAAAERELRGRLRGLPAAEPPPGLEADLRRRLRRAGRRRSRWLLPVAAGIALGYVWIRGAAPFVAWELARDHAHCFGMKALPAAITSRDPAEVAAWFDRDRDPGWMPAIPASVGPFELVGGRYCPLPGGSRAAHVYYVGAGRQVSLFVIARRVRFRGSYSTTVHGRAVSLLRLAGTTVGIVGERPRDVDAFQRSLTVSVATGADGSPAPAAPTTRSARSPEG
jgi:hypothetical protein